ncbi:MAG: hypothetical protein QM737_02725 [Ferruginibacter sp.]
MLLLDKTLQTNYIYPTVTPELTYYGNSFYLEVIEKFTNKKYGLVLGQNYSTFTSRYDMFRISPEQIAGWGEGEYQYTIWERTGEGELIGELEVGILKVAGSDSEPYRSLEETDQSTDEFKVYQGI